MKTVWGPLFPILLVGIGASGCGQSDSGAGPSLPVAGSAGASAGSSGAGSGGTSGGSGNAGTAGLPPSGGAPSAGAAGAAAGAAGGSAGVGGTPGVGSGCTAPGTMCWDFEGGALPTGWSAYRNEFEGQLLVDTSKAHQGTFALHAKGLKGGAEGAQGGPKKTIRFNLPAAFGPTLWGRMWLFTSVVPMSHSGLFNARYARPNTTDTAIEKLDWYEVATYTGKYMSIWHPPEPPGFPEWVKVSGTPGVANDWACLEWLFDGANGNAPQAADPRVWLNGTELTWPMEYVFADPATTVRPVQEKATNFSLLEVGVYLYQGLPGGSETWIDQLAVGKERIGCQ